MVLEDNNKGKLEDKNSSINLDLNMVEDIDLDSLKKEMETIKDAINNDSLDLSQDEIVNLRRDLELISNIIEENSKSDSESISNNENNMHDIVDDSVGDVADLGVDDSVDNAEPDFSIGDLVLTDTNIMDDESDLDYAGDDLILNSNDLEYDESTDEPDDVDSDISVDDALTDLMGKSSDEIAIKVENLSMDFKVSKDKIDTLKEFVIRTVKRNKNPTRTVHALKNVSFEITKGDRVGIIGFNGAGKSTLLKLLSCVYYPTEGTIETKGKIAPLLELGAGFDYNYSGKDNIFLNGAFLGYSEDFLKEKYDEIVEFSELGDAINYHVKTYSSGMRAKLGFSIATIVEPDILILDEILSVGDIRFRRKSADKIKSLINSGITVLLVSHSVSQIRDLCNKAIWLDNGELKMMGNVNEVCDEYVKASIRATSEQLENLDLN